MGALSTWWVRMTYTRQIVRDLTYVRKSEQLLVNEFNGISWTRLSLGTVGTRRCPSDNRYEGTWLAREGTIIGVVKPSFRIVHEAPHL